MQPKLITRAGVITGGLLLAAAAGAAHAAVPPTIVEFSEVAPAPGTNLSGSNAYAAFGIHFNGSTTYDTDPLFVPAGTDNSGIRTGTTPNFMGVLFDAGAESVTFNALSLNTIFVATAFDSGNNVLDTFTSSNATGPQYFSHTFSGVGTIARVEFHDNAQFIGVGRLEFVPVPEPAAGVIALTSLAGLQARRRRRR